MGNLAAFTAKTIFSYGHWWIINNLYMLINGRKYTYITCCALKDAQKLLTPHKSGVLVFHSLSSDTMIRTGFYLIQKLLLLANIDHFRYLRRKSQYYGRKMNSFYNILLVIILCMSICSRIHHALTSVHSKLP